MSDNNVPQMGKAVGPTEATEIALKQANGPDLNKMTGAEAKAWVESQKAPKEAPVSSKESVKQAVEEAKRKLKIGDEEVDEEEVIKTYKSRKEHQREANKRFQEGLNARKQAEEFVGMLKDPEKLISVLAKMGHDPRQLAEQYLGKILTDEVMDPKEKEIRDMRNRIQEIENMERQQKEDVERQRHEQMKTKFAEEYQTKFIDALKESGLPPTKPMVAEIAKYISRATKLGYEISPSEAATLVLEDIKQAQTRLIGDSSGEMLIKLLGEDVANKIRKWDTDRLKDPNKYVNTPSEQPQPREKRESHRRLSAKEWQLHKRGLK